MGGLARKCTVINNSKDAGNGIWDEGEEFIDIGNGKCDEGEEFFDSNLNGVYDKGEEFIDIGNGVWNEGEEFEEEGFKTIVLDAGNLFFKKEKFDPGINLDTAKENAYIILESFNHITCDAFSPSSKDFAAGVNFLKELSLKSNFDYISCNIKDESSRLLFKDYKIIEIDDLSIGIIGASSVFNMEGLIIEDPFRSIKNTASIIKDQCDFIVLLFSASDRDYKILRQSNDLGIDFIVRGNTRMKSTDGGKNKIPIYSTGDRRKNLYQFDFRCQDSALPLIDIAFYERSIKLNRNIVNVWNSKAVTLYKLKKYPEALKCCEKAIKLGTKDKETLDCFKKIKKMITKQPTKKQTQPRTDPKGSAGQYYFI